MTGSPDARWRDPRFALRRLLRRPTARLAAYAPPALSGADRAALRDAAIRARTPGGPEVCLILGVMPRSGTNYVERLLTAHPDAEAPETPRELPALACADAIRPFEAALARHHPTNDGPPYLWLAYALAGQVNALRAGSGAGAIVLKDPHVRHLGLLDALMPRERAVLVLRDGRRLIDSTLRTWPPRRLGRTFEDLCLEWAAATTAALDHAESASPDALRLLRYEEAAADPLGCARGLCAWLGLDPDRLPAAAVEGAPVLGSSTHSRDASGAVGWSPVERPEGFDPAGRAVEWPGWRERIFARVCGPVQRRAGYPD